MIAYLCYLVKIQKRHPQIDLYFLIAGHTKFGADGNFGTIKLNIKEHNVYSIRDLKGPDGMAQTASSNIEIFYRDPKTRKRNFCFHDWKKVLCEKVFAMSRNQRLASS